MPGEAGVPVPGEAGVPVLTLAEVAQLVGGRLEGDGNTPVRGIGPVDEVRGEDQVAFLATKRYARFVPDSTAGAYLVASALESYVPEGIPCVVVDDAYPALREGLAHFHPDRAWTPEVHSTAVIGKGVSLGEGIRIGPYAVIEPGAVIGDCTRIGAHCVVGCDSEIGRDCLFYPHVVVYHDCSVGDRVILHSGVRVGSDGFGFTFVDGEHRKMPQVGRCIVEDDVEIGANSTLDRGSLGDTVIGKGSKLDNLVHMAHNVRVGALSLFAALVGVAGSVRIGQGVWMGGQVGVSNHLEIGDGARLAIATKLMRDVPAGETMSGHPARPHREQMKKQAHLGRMPKLIKRVERLESAVSELSDDAQR